jgi:hypothetical protein
MIQHRTLPAVITAITVLSLQSVRADDFAGKDFSLRLPAALGRFEPFADVAAKGGSSAALPFGSSNNPAAGAWNYPDGFDNNGKPTNYRMMLSGQYSNVAFDNGTQLHFASDSINFGTAETGVLRLDTGAITSNERMVRNLPASFGFDLGGGRLNYAKRFGDLSIGATAGYLHSTTTFSAGGTNIVDAEKDIWNFRLGALWNPAKSNWFLGVVSTYIYGPTDTSALVRLPGGRTLLLNSSDTTNQFTVQPGIAYHWRRDDHIQGYIHADYQFVNLSNSTGSLTEHRFLAGVDIPIHKAIYARAGVFTDAKGNTGWSSGVGIYLDHHVLLDLAYQNNNFPEVARELGRSRTLNACVTVRW